MADSSQGSAHAGGGGAMNNKPRLIITKMVLENFKSYAGRQEIGPFHKSFSCVVGPNGSGKSNVIDALLFVFGKKASKIRLKKVSELIHRSDNYPDLQMAKVSVYFQDIIDADDGTFQVVPGSEMVISRTADVNNNSKYYINNSTSSFTEVTTLLKGKGIDLDYNRFLILQGEVEQIALMKPKAQNKDEDGLLEFIEDIIGTSQYHAKIEEAAKKVEELNEARTEKLNRVKIVEKDKENLEGAKNEAEAYLAKERELDIKRLQLYKVFRQRAENNLEIVNKTKKEFEEKLANEKAKLKEHQAKLTDIEKVYKATKKEYDELVKEMKTTNDGYEKYTRKDTELRETLKFNKKKIKNLKDKIKTSHDQIRELKRAIDIAEQDRKASLEKVAQKTPLLQREEAELEKMLSAVQKETEHLRIDLEKKNKELLPWTKEITKIDQKINVTKQEASLIEQKAASIQNQYKEAIEKLEQTATDLEQKEQDKKEYEQQRHKAVSELSTLKSQLETVDKEEQKTNEECKALRAKVSEQRHAVANSKNQNAVLTALLEAKRKSILPGLYDRLGNLGTIDPKYDVAISTACGSLDHIVVDTAATATKCVEYLKENNIGRATFVMLDKIENLRERASTKIKTPENVPRLFDLIKPKDKKFLTAFYKGVADTLVANDMEQATRIAYGEVRYRVVTLDGKLIDLSGTMSGGGNTVQRGGMSASFEPTVSKEELQQTEAELAKCESKLQKLREQKTKIEDDIKHLQDTIDMLGLSIQKVELDAKALATQTKDLKARIQELKPQLNMSTQDKARLEELQEQVSQYEAEAEKVKKTTKPLQDQIDKLKDQISKAGGVKLETKKYKVSDLTKEIDSERAKATKLEVQIEENSKKIKKLEKQVTKDEEELQSLEESNEKTVAETKELEESAHQVVKAHEKAKKMVEEKEQILKEKEADYDKVKKKVDKIKQVEVDIEAELESCNKQYKENKDKVDAINKQISNLEKQIKSNAINDADGDEVMQDVEQQANEEETEQQEEQQENNEMEISDNEEEEEEDEEDEEEEEEEEQSSKSKRGGKKGKKGGKKKAPAKKKQNNKKQTQKKSGNGYLSQSTEEDLIKREKEIKYAITILESELKEMKPNMNAIKEYRAKEAEYKARVEELDKITQERNTAQKEYEHLRKRRLDEFMVGFNIITMKLKEMYQMITLGGDAELELVDTLDPFSEGIVFSVRPPRKSWKNIVNLSGGEKTLSSLALVFALHHYKPTPLYVMDEIDAALDFKNVSIVANYIKERTKNAQFVIISLRNNMFELADRLVGIYKTSDCTHSVTINPHSIALPAPTTTATMAEEDGDDGDDDDEEKQLGSSSYEEEENEQQ